MNPSSPNPVPAPEQQPVSGAQMPDALPVPGTLADQIVTPPPAAPIAPDPSTAGATIVAPQATGNPSPVVAAPVVASMPVIADDVDVIEKEWVDKADEIRKSTVGDPYTEEEAVETLQQQYLKQRYGRDVGKPTNE